MASVLLIGIKSNDRQWFIRPDQNILFVSYWFACFNVLITALTAVFAFLAFREQWKILHMEEQDEMQQIGAPYGVDGYGKPYEAPPTEISQFLVPPSVAPGDVPLAPGAVSPSGAPPGYSPYGYNQSFAPTYSPPPGPPTTTNVYTSGANAGGYMASGAVPGTLSPAAAPSVGYLPPAAPSGVLLPPGAQGGVLLPPGAPSGVLFPAPSGFLMPPGQSGYLAPGSGAPSGYLPPPGSGYLSPPGATQQMYATGGYAAGGYK